MSIDIQTREKPLIRPKSRRRHGPLLAAGGGVILLALVATAASLPGVRESVLAAGDPDRADVLKLLRDSAGEPESVEIVEFEGPIPAWQREYEDGSKSPVEVVRVRFRHATGFGGKIVSTAYLEKTADGFEPVSKGRETWLDRFGWEEAKRTSGIK